MLAPHHQEPSTLIKMLAPSMLSSRAPSSQGQSSSGSEGFVTPAKEEKGPDLGHTLSRLLDKFLAPQDTSL